MILAALFPHGNGNVPYEQLSFPNLVSLANLQTAVSLLSGKRSLPNMVGLFRFKLRDR